MLVLHEGLDPILWAQHINIVLLWAYLTTALGLSIHDMYKKARLIGYNNHRLVPLVFMLTFGALIYQFWLMLYIYYQWVQRLIIAVKLMYTFPILAVLTHTLYQMYFLSTTRNLGDHTYFVLINSAVNIVMLLHLGTIMVVVKGTSTFTWQQLAAFALETLYRLYSLGRYYQLYVYRFFVNIKLSNANQKNELVATSNSIPYKRCEDDDESYLYRAVQSQDRGVTSAQFCCQFFLRPSAIFHPFSEMFKDGNKMLSCTVEFVLECAVARLAPDLAKGDPDDYVVVLL